jgi:hypothetical protein
MPHLPALLPLFFTATPWGSYANTRYQIWPFDPQVWRFLREPPRGRRGSQSMRTGAASGDRASI